SNHTSGGPKEPKTTPLEPFAKDIARRFSVYKWAAMPSARWILLAYLALSLYDAGMSWVLQLMHYPLYHDVGSAELSRYVQRNNQCAVVPAIVPALATFGVSLLLVWQRPVMIPPALAMAAVLLNIVVLISTALWQGVSIVNWPRPENRNPRSI